MNRRISATIINDIKRKHETVQTVLEEYHRSHC